MKKSRKAVMAPRKSPQQKRSLDMVASILEAATRILKTGNIQNLNTNHIAQQAGISIGSLYQYFPSKEAILTALVQKHVENEFPLIQSKIEELSLLNNKQKALKLFLNFLIKIYAQNKKLRIAFIDVIKQTGHQKTILNLETQLGELFFTRILGYTSKNSDFEIKTFIFAKAVIGIIRAAVLEHDNYLDQENLVDELTDLFSRWLVG